MRVQARVCDPGAPRPARACTHMGVCVTHIREAILSRSKGFSPLGWCVGIVGGIGFVRCSLRVVNAPPLVVDGVVVCLWGFVRAWIVRPLLCTGAGGHAVTCTSGCSHTCTCAYRRVCGPTCARGCCAYVCERPNLCTRSLAWAPPFALGCVRVRARWRPHIYIIPTKNISQQFLWIRVAPLCLRGGVLGSGEPNRFQKRLIEYRSAR